MVLDPSKKRRHPRVPVSLPVTGVWWTAQDPKKSALVGLLVALSEGGATLRSGTTVPANGVVEFSFKLGFLKTYKARGVVRWWRRNGETRELGVMFDVPIPAVGTYVRAQLGLPEKK